MPDYPIRRSIRLPDHDYASPGACFITVCTRNRDCLLGEIRNGRLCISPAGEEVAAIWRDIPLHFAGVELDAFEIMPNHVHGIIVIHGRGTACRAPTEDFGQPVAGSIPTIVRSFKAEATRRISTFRRTPGAPVWQRGYYEHVIRSSSELDRLRQYIESNPLRWDLDHENPAHA